MGIVKRRGLIGRTEDRHEEHTALKQLRVMRLLMRLAINSRTSFGSWDQSAMDESGDKFKKCVTLTMHKKVCASNTTKNNACQFGLCNVYLGLREEAQV